MSSGELIIDDNQIKPAVGSSGDWAEEYQTQYNAGPDTWANEFAREEVSSLLSSWLGDYAFNQAVFSIWSWCYFIITLGGITTFELVILCFIVILIPDRVVVSGNIPIFFILCL